MSDTPSPNAAPVTAGVLVIGDEILSGRTKDTNSGYIADYLTEAGIDLREVRIVPDDRDMIVEALNALRSRWTYVFTTGGIGPTHDDITADCVAAAFSVGIDHDPRAVAMLRERIADQDLNESRLRMARIPDGADLIENRLTKAPGFRIGNVFVLAGVPSIMKVMLEAVRPSLEGGPRMLSATVRADLREGDVAAGLKAIAVEYPEVMIGSYPFRDEAGLPNTNLVVRSRDADKLEAARGAVERMVVALRPTVKR
jgi:molybdenum cofactor synthesis domain-containing protein